MVMKIKRTNICTNKMRSFLKQIHGLSWIYTDRDIAMHENQKATSKKYVDFGHGHALRLAEFLRVFIRLKYSTVDPLPTVIQRQRALSSHVFP